MAGRVVPYGRSEGGNNGLQESTVTVSSQTVNNKYNTTEGAGAKVNILFNIIGEKSETRSDGGRT